ncbi:MAG TPA: hypothetical protein VFL61_00360 [Gaiellaceae bacterium]|nr:hypothetical protein [Gaiellaceae bacterium]
MHNSTSVESLERRRQTVEHPLAERESVEIDYCPRCRESFLGELFDFGG